MNLAVWIGAGVILLCLGVIYRKVAHVSAQGDAIKGVVDKIRASVDKLIERLSDNLTGEELASVEAAGDEIATALDQLDPAVPGGPVDDTGGETPPA